MAGMRPTRRDEVRLSPAKSGGRLRVALCYPNRYFVGMSNLGLHAVYRLFNAERDVVCERAFLPDEAAGTGRKAARLVTVESGAELRRFDVVAFTVSFESDYPGVLRMLSLAGIPLRAADRRPRDPLVVLGGAATFLNPEPLAPFADLVAVGEGEALVGPLVAALLGAPDLRRGLEALPPARGFYVPSRHEVRYHPDGTVAAIDGPSPVVRQRARPGAAPLPQSAFLTPDTEMSRRFLVEISRGCPCLCRFCWAGYGYLPVRAFAREAVLARAREARPHTDRIGLVSTAVAAHPEAEALVEDLAALGFEVSVSSLRLDDLTPGLAEKLARSGAQGLTLAPECGSERLRRVLNKPFGDEEVVSRAEWVFAQGIRNLRLYFMVGLPGEQPEDVEAIVSLVSRVRERMVEAGRGRGRLGRLQPSVNPFVPKPGTPFQWQPLEDPRRTDARLRQLRRALGRLANVEPILKSARAGLDQALLARGDRRLADALELAATEGLGLGPAAEAVGLDVRPYLFRERAPDEVLPWDVVDNGVSRAFLLAERERGRQGLLSPPCPQAPGCLRCGACAPGTA